MKHKSVLGLVLILLTASISFTGCGIGIRDTNRRIPGKVNVVASFHGMAMLAECIGGRYVSVRTIIPDGTEPHDFELKAADIAELNQADLFVYNGLGMEPWAEKALRIVNHKKLTVVEAAKGAKAISSMRNGGEGKYDPHVWLSLSGAEYEAGKIYHGLVHCDPHHAQYYDANYRSFCQSMEQMLAKYQQSFNKIGNKSFVTGHAAFAYLCRDFGLTQNSVEGVFAEGEPSIRKLASLIQYCKANKVHTIFVEDLVSPRVSQTLADEVGAITVKLNTIESSEGDGTEGKGDFKKSLEEDLNKIYDSLK